MITSKKASGEVAERWRKRFSSTWAVFLASAAAEEMIIIFLQQKKETIFRGVGEDITSPKLKRHPILKPQNMISFLFVGT